MSNSKKQKEDVDNDILSTLSNSTPKQKISIFS